jgi:hypothetical protein
MKKKEFKIGCSKKHDYSFSGGFIVHEKSYDNRDMCNEAVKTIKRLFFFFLYLFALQHFHNLILTRVKMLNRKINLQSMSRQ